MLKRQVLQMRKISKAVKMIVALALVFSMLTVSALAGVNVVVMPESMKVYFAPTVASEQIGALPRGTVVSVEATNGEWSLVKFMGYAGFVKTEALCSLQPMAAKVKVTYPIQYISQGNFEVRWTILQAGSTVYVRGAKEGFWLISDAGMNVLGYVPMGYLAF